ncbi:MAG TPA: hypothetical protein VKE98_10160 [Gemmataceae bacterium]|nr:hypothetical protein [Gemmataceae bacterium]
MSDPPLEIGNKEVNEAALTPEKDVPPRESAESEEPLSKRSENASRALRATIVGLVFFPSGPFLLPYSIWLLYHVFHSKESLEPRARRHALIAAALNASVFLFVLFMLISPLIPRRDPRFEYPREMVGAWVSADGAVEMELRKNGRLFYRAKGPPEIEFSGTWGVDLHFVLKVRSVTKGADFLPFPKDQFVAWRLHHYSDREIVFGEKEKQLRLVRKQ